MKKILELREQELLLRLRQGDERAFTAIYLQYWEKLLAIAYKLTKEKDLAEEIVQDVFLSLWTRRNEVHIDSVEKYLATAIKYATFKKLTRQRRHEEIEAMLFSQEQYQSLDEQIDARFLSDYVKGVVERLPERCRLVFKSSREDLKSNAEIAKEQNISEKAVEANITRALKKIRHSLDKGWFLLFYIALVVNYIAQK